MRLLFSKIGPVAIVLYERNMERNERQETRSGTKVGRDERDKQPGKACWPQ